MIYLRACQKCNGDVELTKDSYGMYLTCLHCSYTIGSTKAAKENIKKTKSHNSTTPTVL